MCLLANAFTTVIYMTNAIESVTMGLRTLIKNRGSFPSDEALTKLFHMALRNISQKLTMPLRDWKAALIRFTIHFHDDVLDSGEGFDLHGGARWVSSGLKTGLIELFGRLLLSKPGSRCPAPHPAALAR